MRKILGIVLVALGIVSLVIGGVFIQQSYSVKYQIMNAIKAQRIFSSGQMQQFVLNTDDLNNPASITKVVPPTGTATAPVSTTVVIPPGTIVNLSEKITGIIDTPAEVKLMADTLMAHLAADWGKMDLMDTKVR